MRILRPVVFMAAFAVIVLWFFSGCETDTKQYLRMAKTTFERSVANDPRAAEFIDWNSIIINDDQLGRGFMTLTTDYEKGSFKSAAIANLSRIFAARGWNVTNVRNWRVEAQGVESAIVVGDAPGGKLTIWFQKVNLEKRIARISTN